jgi:hypothetical protein
MSVRLTLSPHVTVGTKVGAIHAGAVGFLPALVGWLPRGTGTYSGDPVAA